MRFLVISRQRPNLSSDELGRLYAAANQFYTQRPAGVTLECDYVTMDRAGSYSVLEVPDRATIDRIMEPFAGVVDVQILEVMTAVEAMSQSK